MLPAPQRSSWLVVYRDLNKGKVGAFLSADQNSPGETAVDAILADWNDVRPALGGTGYLSIDKSGRDWISDSRVFGNLNNPIIRREAFSWLAERVNAFINVPVLRPRLRDAAADMGDLVD